MDPKLLSILTVFIIGLVSFLIGYFLTSSGEKSELKKLQEENEVIKKEQLSIKEGFEIRKNKISKLSSDLDNTSREVNNLKQVNAKLSDENRRLNSISHSPSGKLYKQEYESMYEQYIDEMEKRKELEKEKFTLLKEKGNNATENSSSQTAINRKAENIVAKVSDVNSRLSSIFSRVGFGNALHRDDLTKITGIGPDIQSKLNKIGVYNYKQLANLAPADLDTIDEAIQHFPGSALRDDWIGQAKNLA